MLPGLSELTQKVLFIPYGDPVFWGSLIAILSVCSFLAGGYPAFYLSSFDSVKILKGTFKSGRSAMNLRKGLTILQFTP